jgi:cobalamin biosynthesis Co2+ chelatase CbiK
MDEVMFLRAYQNLHVLVDYIEDVHTKNALLTVCALLKSLNHRINEMQTDDSDGEEE